MIKLLDPSQHQKKAILDADDNPVKIVADHLRVIHFTYDEEPKPHVIATCVYVTEKGERIGGTQTQFRIEGEPFDYLMTPKESEKGRKQGNFHVEDIEECIVHFGDFPGASFSGKIELIR
jgi:hypothetical protein